ncbi:MAG: HAD-IA family hydrolase [Oceanospirillales bacterium]|nr:HAD-IA family hydrolase [Oceanospirillales bacterium]
MTEPNVFFLLKALSNWQPLDLNVPQPPTKSGSLASLDELTIHETDIDCVSFDIFDTLLRRDVDPPKAVLHLVASWLASHLKVTDIQSNAQKLLSLRKDAEAHARQESLQRGLDAECTLTEIANGWIERIKAVNPDAYLPSVAELVDYEVRLERERLSPMPGALSLLKRLKAEGKRVIAISDMYLEHEHLQAILKHHGLLECIDDLYVSSRFGLSKGSGRLFEHLKQTGEISTTTLHIGDHAVSDVSRPQAAGLRARHLYNPEEYQRRRTMELGAKAWLQYGDASHLWGNTRQPQEPVARIGYQRLGPIFTLYASALVQQAHTKAYDRVFFLARDGFLIQQLYDKLAAGLDLFANRPLPKSQYIYLSRASTRFAGMSGKPEELLSLAQRVNRQQGAWAVLSTLGLPKDAYTALITEILNNDSPQDLDSTSAQIKALIQDQRFIDRVEQDLASNRQQLHDYLAQEGLFVPEANHLLADIGWNGSILSTLETAFGNQTDFPHVDALYFGRLHGSEVNQINLMSGFAYDEQRAHPIEQLINECRELFEVASSSVEGSTLGYRTATDGRIVPHIGTPELEDDERQTIQNLQSGILAWCDDFIDFSNRFGFHPDALRPQALLECTALLSGRDAEELSVLSSLSFDLSWGSSSRVSLGEYLGVSAKPSSDAPSARKESFALTLHDDQDKQSTSNPQKLFEKIHLFVEALRLEGPLVFYGVGTSASLLAPLVKEQILYFVDGNTSLHGQEFLGKPIQAPEVAIDDEKITLVMTPIGRKNVLQKRIESRRGKTLYLDDFL